MARRVIPDALKRRHLVETQLDAARARRLADAYLEQGRHFEALDFLAQSGDRERLAQLRDEAMAAGDVFLLRESCARLEEEPDAAAWRAVAEAASAAGKEGYASEARRQLAAKEG